MKQTETFLRKRRFLTFIPLFIYPFLCLIFWGLGGGQATAKNSVIIADDGLNRNLPGAQISDRKTDMLSLYDKAARDSAKLKELREIETKHWLQDTLSHDASVFENNGSASIYRPNRVEATESKVNDRLAQLQKSLEQASTPVHKEAPIITGDVRNEENLKKMEQLMATSGTMEPSAEDPEIKTLNGMLDKILEIQNPGRNQAVIKEKSKEQKGRIFTFSSQTEAPNLLIKRQGTDSIVRRRSANRFYTAKQPKSDDSVTHNAVKAIVYEGGQFASGAKIKMMLQEDVYLNGVKVPAGSFVYGFGEVQDERFKVRIESMGVNESIFKVNLSVYDSDAQEGISAPGAITRNEVKASASSVLQSIDINSYDPSLGAQAANAGIETAKSIVGKKAKMVFANINAGRKIFLLDDTEKR